MRASSRASAIVAGLACLLVAGVAFGHGKPARKPARAQEVKVSVTTAGFQPSSIVVKEGVPIVMLITRKTDQTCAKEAVFPTIDKQVELPLGKTVRVALPAQSAGRLSYSCGMDMLHGELVVK